MAAPDVSVTDGPTPITFADLGVPAPDPLEDDLIGTSRKISNISKYEQLYLCGMVLAILALVVFTIIRLTQVNAKSPDFLFCLVLIVNALFSIFYVFDGLKRERPSELFILSLAVILMVIYLVANFASSKEKTNLKLSRMVVACVFAIPLVLLGFFLMRKYHQENHLIFRIVGANSLLQNFLIKLYCFQDLLKFDFELQLSLIILVFGSEDSLYRNVIIVAVGAPLTIAWFFIGYLGFAKEKDICVLFFFLLCLPGIAYMFYILYDVSSYIDKYPGLASATIACGCIVIIVRALVILLGFLVFRGFGKGLEVESNPNVVNENA